MRSIHIYFIKKSRYPAMNDLNINSLADFYLFIVVNNIFIEWKPPKNIDPITAMYNFFDSLENSDKKSGDNRKNSIKQEQKHRSCAEMIKKRMKSRKLKKFNNKTREGQFFTEKPPQIPYLFIPKYKNDTFIMPDRIFQRGKAGKRLHIKMKDTSIYSFNEPENSQIKKVIRHDEKDHIINGRKMEEFNRIVNEMDGKEKSQRAIENLKSRKIFNATITINDVFSVTSPLLGPKQTESIELRKKSLDKTFMPNMWRTASRGSKYPLTATNSFWNSESTQRYNLNRTASQCE